MPRMPNECFSNIASKYWSRHSNINPWLSDAEIASFAHSDSFLFHLIGRSLLQDCESVSRSVVSDSLRPHGL